MKKIIFIFIICFSAVIFSGCQALRQFTHTGPGSDNPSGVVPLPSYSGPKARITVADFDVKSAKASNQTGSSLREVLITALINSNRFSVIAHQELKAAAQGQEPAAATGQQQDSAPRRSQVKLPELIITAAVTDFEPQASGGSSGIGGGGGAGSGLLGGLLGGSLNKAHITLDVRIVDASTSAVLAASKIQGQATDRSSQALIGFFGNWPLGPGLAAYANTPMEKAIRICIVETVRYIAQTVPADYYKYNKEKT